MMEEARIEELHSSLDNLALHNLNLLDELLKERQKFELALREGFFEITRARHAMGSKSVSILQLPAEEGKDVAALVKVDRYTENDDLIENVQFTIASKETEIVEEKDGLRKRAGKKSVLDKDITIENNKFDVKEDPLRWFGVLVPHSLRNGQQIFHKSAYSACKIASLQCNLQIGIAKYKKLLEEMLQLTNEY